MKIADFKGAAMEWTMTIEGRDEYGDIQRAQVQIEKGFERLASGEIGLSIECHSRLCGLTRCLVFMWFHPVTGFKSPAKR
jgi:hypothetical protein